MPEKLEALRARLDQVDREIVEALSRRQALVSEIGEEKRSRGRPLRDFGREKVVLEGVRELAFEAGLDPELAEVVFRALIRSSLETQERERVVAAAEGSGRRALVLGGAGKMGRWFADFLDAQGYGVEIADPAGPVPGYPFLDPAALGEPGDPVGPVPDHDLVVVAASLPASARILLRLEELRPPGVVFDVGSLKSPLLPGLEALAAAGVRVTSIHPMFGPDTKLLSGRHVLFCDAGHPGATEVARELFRPTLAERIDIPLEEHDRLVAYVLGLSHAVNIAFFTALERSGEAAPVLARLSSTTFDAQLGVATRVAAENPHLYYEIQALNHHGDTALEALEEAVAAVAGAVRGQDEAAFVELMTRGRRYLATREG